MLNKFKKGRKKIAPKERVNEWLQKPDTRTKEPGQYWDKYISDASPYRQKDTRKKEEYKAPQANIVYDEKKRIRAVDPEEYRLLTTPTHVQQKGEIPLYADVPRWPEEIQQRQLWTKQAADMREKQTASSPIRQRQQQTEQRLGRRTTISRPGSAAVNNFDNTGGTRSTAPSQSHTMSPGKTFQLRDDELAAMKAIQDALFRATAKYLNQEEGDALLDQLAAPITTDKPRPAPKTQKSKPVTLKTVVLPDSRKPEVKSYVRLQDRPLSPPKHKQFVSSLPPPDEQDIGGGSASWAGTDSPGARKKSVFSSAWNPNTVNNIWLKANDPSHVKHRPTSAGGLGAGSWDGSEGSPSERGKKRSQRSATMFGRNGSQASLLSEKSGARDENSTGSQLRSSTANESPEKQIVKTEIPGDVDPSARKTSITENVAPIVGVGATTVVDADSYANDADFVIDEEEDDDYDADADFLEAVDAAKVIDKPSSLPTPAMEADKKASSGGSGTGSHNSSPRSTGITSPQMKSTGAAAESKLAPTPPRDVKSSSVSPRVVGVTECGGATLSPQNTLTRPQSAALSRPQSATRPGSTSRDRVIVRRGSSGGSSSSGAVSALLAMEFQTSLAEHVKAETEQAQPVNEVSAAEAMQEGATTEEPKATFGVLRPVLEGNEMMSPYPAGSSVVSAGEVGSFDIFDNVGSGGAEGAVETGKQPEHDSDPVLAPEAPASGALAGPALVPAITEGPLDSSLIVIAAEAEKGAAAPSSARAGVSGSNSARQKASINGGQSYTPRAKAAATAVAATGTAGVSNSNDVTPHRKAAPGGVGSTKVSNPNSSGIAAGGSSTQSTPRSANATPRRNSAGNKDFTVGQSVVVKIAAVKGGKAPSYSSATVEKKNDDGTFEVKFVKDGKTEKKVALNRIQNAVLASSTSSSVKVSPRLACVSQNVPTQSIPAPTPVSAQSAPGKLSQPQTDSSARVSTLPSNEQATKPELSEKKNITEESSNTRVASQEGEKEEAGSNPTPNPTLSSRPVLPLSGGGGSSFLDALKLKKKGLKKVEGKSEEEGKSTEFCSASTKVSTDINAAAAGTILSAISTGTDRAIKANIENAQRKAAFGAFIELSKKELQMELPEFMSDCQVNSLLGRGKFASVYSGLWNKKGGGVLPVAVKIAQFYGSENYLSFQSPRKNGKSEMLIADPMPSEMEGKENAPWKRPPLSCISEFTREIRSLKKLKGHDKLVQLQGYVLRPFAVVLSLSDGGCLHMNLRDLHWQHSAGIAERLLLMQDICEGLAFVHKNGFIHRDIKTHNILLESCPQMSAGRLGRKFTAKIADFGSAIPLSIAVNSEGHYCTEPMGTSGYTAPEIFIPGKYSFPADVFAFAVACWELLPHFRSAEAMHVSAQEAVGVMIVHESITKLMQTEYGTQGGGGDASASPTAAAVQLRVPDHNPLTGLDPQEAAERQIELNARPPVTAFNPAYSSSTNSRGDVDGEKAGGPEVKALRRAVELISKCWVSAAEQRPSMQGALGVFFGEICLHFC